MANAIENFFIEIAVKVQNNSFAVVDALQSRINKINTQAPTKSFAGLSESIAARAGTISSNLTHISGKFNQLKLAGEQAGSGIGKAMFGAELAVGGIATASISAILKLDDIQDKANILGLSAKFIQQFGIIATENDSSLEAVSTTLTSVSSKIGEAATGFGRGKIAFEKYGLSAKFANGETKNAGDILGEIAEKFQKLGDNNAEKLAIARKLGIDETLIPLLSQGQAAVKKLFDESDGRQLIDDKDFAAADQFEKDFAKLKNTIGQIFTKISVNLIPVFNQFISKISELASSDGKKFVDNFTSALSGLFLAVQPIINSLVIVIGLIGQFFAFLNKNTTAMQIFTYALYGLIGAFGAFKAVSLVSSIISIGGAIIGVIPVVFSLAGAITTLTVAMLANPIGAIIAGVIALGSALYLLYNNWNTVVGAIAKGTGAIINYTADLSASISGMLSVVFDAIAKGIGAIINYTAGLSASISGTISDVFNIIIDSATNLSATISGALSGVFGAIIAPFQSAFNFILNGINGITQAFSGIGNLVGSVFGVANDINVGRSGAAAVAPIENRLYQQSAAAVAQNNQTNNSTTQNSFTINGASDPQNVANVVAQKLKSQNRDTNRYAGGSIQ